MLRYFFAVVIATFVSHTLQGQDQADNAKDSIYADVEVQAEYPGGMASLYEYVHRNMSYPKNAIKSGIEGKTFIEFVVARSGYIERSSIRTIKSLHPVFDEEAMRVIRECRAQWSPAQQNGEPVSQRFIIPLAFKINVLQTEEVSTTNHLTNKISTVVIAKDFKSFDEKHWALFSDREMTSPLGRVPVGETVKVAGWAAWAFFINSSAGRGYVSWKSLAINSELDSLHKVIALKSEAEQKAQSESAEKTLHNIKPLAHLSLDANKNSVYAGECATLTLSFDVGAENRARLQFYDLGLQLSRILSSDLTVDNCWIVSGNITNITGETIRLNGQEYTRYKIYQGNFCPTVPGVIKIPAIKLDIAQIEFNSNEVDTILAFHSKPLTIKVNPLPSVTSLGPYPMVGKFTLNEKIGPELIYVGEPVTYQLKLTGSGLTFPVEPPKLALENIDSQLINVVDHDSVANGELKSSKTFVYRLTFRKKGTYDFSNKITFTYFDLGENKIKALESKMSVNVQNAITTSVVIPEKTLHAKQTFIAFDASQSMEIEDYTPNRLKAVTGGLLKFLTNRKKCDIGVIVFGGDAKHLRTTDQDSCYLTNSLDTISSNLNRNGTAIGDAIWLAKNSFAKTKLPKKLVIIGDGDNTAGHLPPKFAAELALKDNIRIYTIGVGNKGLVPYGRDVSGKPNMIDDTFTDKDFKVISSITNGQYYWAKDEKEVTRILELIFK